MKSSLVCSLCLFSTLLLVGPAFAAVPGMKTLRGHVPRAALQLKGVLPSTQELKLAIGLPLRDTNGLERFLTELYDPANPNYRHYLTPEQFADRFGPSESDYAAVMAFAKSNHLTLTHIHSGRMLLDVSGSVADIQKAFHIVLQTYSHPAEARDFYAPDMEPTVESNLPVLDVSGLNNYALPHPKSLHPDTEAAGAIPRTGSAANGGYIGNDFRAAYFPGVTLSGSGQQLGLVEFDGYYSSDIASYETAAGIAAIPLQQVLLDGYNGTPTTGASSGNSEVSLDIELAMAMAPGLSKIVVFEAGPNGYPNDILNDMAASNQIKSFSCSWGWGGGPSGTTDNIFKKMAAQGQSFFNAAGDSDAFTSGSASANGVDNPTLANSPSSSPYITVVGGTTLTTAGPGGAWASETVWNWGPTDGSDVGSSGGISSYYPIPAWQSDISMSANGGSTQYRNIPDVALTADNIFVNYGNGRTGSFGGTSCAAPLWAAVAALLNQQAVSDSQSSIGFINPALYGIASGAGYPSAFHDITTGNNTSSASPNGFYAVSGYDLCTGLGTPVGKVLLNTLVPSSDSLSTNIPIPAFQTVSQTSQSFGFSWPTATGFSYQVQFKTNLLQTNWCNLGTPFVGTGGSVGFSDTNAIATSPQRFYRLLVSQP